MSHTAVKSFDRRSVRCTNAQAVQFTVGVEKCDLEDCIAVGKLFHAGAAVELNPRPPMIVCRQKCVPAFAVLTLLTKVWIT